MDLNLEARANAKRTPLPVIDPDLLEVPLGDHRLLARSGFQPGRSLWILDPSAAAIWDATRAGLTPDEIATELAARFVLPAAAIRAEVDRLLALWQRKLDAGHWTLRLADQTLALTIADPELAEALEPLIAHLHSDATAAPTARLYLTGTAADWQLFKDDAWIAGGETRDAALTQTHTQLIATAGAADQRLLVLHTAGLSRAGQGILLIGQGGAGKTTLATALSATGWALLSDDVVPVTPEGHLLGLGLGPCLKAGSWLVLAEYLPHLEQTPVVHRGDQLVRFPPPPGPMAHGPLPTAAFLIPHYQPGSVPACEPLTPVQVLQAIITAEAVLPALDQTRLNALARWVCSAPGFALTYPDLDSALDLVTRWWRQQVV